MDLAAKEIKTTYAIHVPGSVRRVSTAYNALMEQAMFSKLPVVELSIDASESEPGQRKWLVTFAIYVEHDTDETHKRIRQIIRDAVSEPA